MSKVTLTDLVDLQNETTAVNAINANNQTIETAFDNTLSRNGLTPNQMNSVLDMNSNQIINLPAPSTVNSPARLIDVVSNPAIVVPGTGTSGHVLGYLDTNNTTSGNNIHSGTETFNGNVTFTGSVTLPATSSNYWSNTQSGKVSNYTVVQADSATTLILGGGTMFTVTLNAASTYSGNFYVVLSNPDSRGKRISASGLTSFILWPMQTVTIYRSSNQWMVDHQQRWKVPYDTTIYVDAINGVDTNDGLAPGPFGAVKTLNQAIRVNMKDFFDLSGSSNYPAANVRVQLADNAVGGIAGTNAYSLLHMAYNPVGAEGRNCVLVQGNASTPSNVVIADAGGANVGCYGPVSLELRNLQIGQTGATAPIAATCIEASDGATINLREGIVFGTATGAHVQVSLGGRVGFLNNYSVVGGANYHWFCYNNGILVADTLTVTFNNSPAITGQFASALQLGQINMSSMTFVNKGTVTGMRYYAQSNGIIVTATGTPDTYIPGTIAGSSGTGAQVT